MSYSFNEPIISFSSTLAATIGLEETVLLCVLYDAQQWLNMQQQCCVFQSQLEKMLPFWQPEDIQRIAGSLADKGVITLSSAPYTQSARLQFSLPNQTCAAKNNSEEQMFGHHGTHQREPLTTSDVTQQSHGHSQQRTSRTSLAATDMPPKPLIEERARLKTYGAQLISANWQPSKDVLAQLAQHQIPFAFIQEQVHDFVLYWRERGEVAHAWGSRFVKQTIRNWQHHQARVGFEPQAQQAHTMHKNWRPSADALNILAGLAIHNEFIEEATPEFILYWQERGNSTTTWNSLFLKHIKRQWASYSRTLQYDTEPQTITKDWQPSEDAYEVLQLANIDIEFARSEIPSFVLFWLESAQAHSSWNSKYIQHVKYQWAKRHHINIKYAHERQQHVGASSTTKDPDFIRRHQDTSWAEGL